MDSRCFAGAWLLSLLVFTGSLFAEAIPGEFIIKTGTKSGRFAVASAVRDASLAFRSGAELKKSLSPKFKAMKRRSGSDADFCAALKQRLPEVEICSPNQRYHSSAIPNDTYYQNYLWGIQDIGGPAAWDVTTGSEDVIVAVIDTGIDYEHPDLAANVWTNSNEVAGNGIDDDGNGYIDDIHGANMINDGGNPMDDHSHGTHVSGTIGAVGNNDAGVTGINWQVKIMGLKFLDAEGSGSTEDAIQAIQYIIDMRSRGEDIRFSNNSWGGGDPDAALNSAISDLTDSGTLFLAAAGNEANNNDSNPTSPAGHPDAITVAAIDQNHLLADFSNYGLTSVNIGAPGVDIASTYPTALTDEGYTPYAYMSGTSMATPHITGALALALAANPALGNQQLKSLLYSTGTSLAALMFNTTTGRTLNLSELVTTASGSTPEDDSANAPATVSSFRLSSVSGSSVTNRSIARGKKFVLETSGTGTGTVSANFYLGSTKCSAVSYDLTNGAARIIGTVPKKLGKASYLKIKRSSTKASSKLTGKAGTLSAKTACKQLVRGLRVSS